MSRARMHSIPGYSRGLTLVEMMVALVISTVLMAGMVQIFANSKQSNKLIDSLGFMQESGRMAINIITTDLRRAGYLGGNKDIGQMTGGTLAPVTPTATTYDDCNTGDNTWARMFSQRLFGLNDNNTGYACVPNTGATAYKQTGGIGSDVLAVRYVNAQPDANPAASLTTLFVRSTLASGRVFLGSDAAAAVNQLVGVPIAVYPLVANAYYVGTSADTCNGTAIPALYQVTLGAGGQPTAREIVTGIEDLQLRYGWDTDGDGIANRYVDANTLATFSDWNYNGIPASNTIVSVRVWLMARAACEDKVANYKNTNEYTYGEKSQFVFTDNKYRRQLYSATIALRN